MTDRTNFDKILNKFDTLTKRKTNYENSPERALYLLLLEYRDRMPPLETRDDYVYFHKCFRQCDVMDTGNMDMVFWHLLKYSTCFWHVCEEVFDV